jgi:MFS transporter, DHA3 family, macrolide efflux protein
MTGRTNINTLYILLLTQTLSLVGTRISAIAIAFWVIQDSDSPATSFALLILCVTLPMALVANVAGVFVDRWDRRRVMALSDAGQAVGTVLLLVSITSGNFHLWHLYTIAVGQAIFGAFQKPAFTASITMLVPDEKRNRVNTLQEIGMRMGGVIAPAVAGVVYVSVGVEGAIFIDLLTFVVAALVIFSIHIPRPEQTAAGRKMKGSFWQEITSGWRYIWSIRLLFWFRIYLSLTFFILGLIEVLLLPYLLARTDSETTVGILSSIVQAGAVGGGFVMLAWGGTHRRIHTIMPGFIAFGLLISLIGLARTPLTLALILPFFIFPGIAVRTMIVAFMQVKIPADLQGRVFAATGQLSLLLMSLMFVIAGRLADTVFEPAVGKTGWDRVAPIVGDGPGAGIGLMLLIGGLSVALLTLAVYAVPAIRHIETTLPDYNSKPAPESVETEALELEMAEA